MVKIHGKLVDDETRCEHYASVKDIIAIKFYCCDTYYPCYKCHEECTNHAIERWPNTAFNMPAILCGVCKTEHMIETYLNTTRCPQCASLFNENCSFHYHLYFETS